MEVLITGDPVSVCDMMADAGSCPGWCTYNPDTNCWDDGD